MCSNFHENILDIIKIIELKRFTSKNNSKGHNYAKLVGRISSFFLCSSPDEGTHLHQVYENNMNGIRVME